MEPTRAYLQSETPWSARTSLDDAAFTDWLQFESQLLIAFVQTTYCRVLCLEGAEGMYLRESIMHNWLFVHVSKASSILLQKVGHLPAAIRASSIPWHLDTARFVKEFWLQELVSSSTPRENIYLTIIPGKWLGSFGALLLQICYFVRPILCHSCWSLHWKLWQTVSHIFWCSISCIFSCSPKNVELAARRLDAFFRKPFQSANATKKSSNAVLVYQRGLYQLETKRTETNLLTLPVCHILFGVEGRTSPVSTVPHWPWTALS